MKRDSAALRAKQLARIDTTRALEAARGIADHATRAFALAWVGRFAPQATTKSILAEARKATFRADDPHQGVSAAAWWLRAMIERGDRGAARNAAKEVIGRCRSIDHPVNRLEALFLIFQAVFELDDARALAADALVNASSVANSWKSGDRLRQTAVMLAASYPREAQVLIAAMPEGKHKRQAVARASSSHPTGLAPRQFF